MDLPQSENISLRFSKDDGDQYRLDDIKLSGTMEGAATPPSISNITQSPTYVTSTDAVSIAADVEAGDAVIDNVELHWNTDNDFDTYTTINMSLAAGDTYITDTDIPVQADGTTVYYRVYAEDVDDEFTTSAVSSYTVRDPKTTSLPYLEDFADNLGDTYVYTVAGVQLGFIIQTDGQR